MYKFIQQFEMDRFLTILFSFHYDTVNLCFQAQEYMSIRVTENETKCTSGSHCQYVNNLVNSYS